MAIKIHHGPNGSYKTSGAIVDDAIPAALAGRYIITNIRGMSRARFEAVFDNLPDSFDLEYINFETAAGIERVRTWFQWAPRNAFLIFDEAQTLFPKKWNDKYLERYDYPGGLDKSNADDRPMNFLDAWTRHRHWNWDIVLTTPNIKYVHDDIRNTSEAAYQHSNLALLGKWMKKLVAKDYKEAMHSAQENRAPTDGSNIVSLRKIDSRAFKLYDSTATGLHRDTMAGKNALTSPRVLLLVGVLVAVFGYLYFHGGASVFTNPLGVPSVKTAVSLDPAPVHQNTAQGSNLDLHRVSDRQTVSLPSVAKLEPFSDYDISLEGSIWSKEKGIIFSFRLVKDNHTLRLTTRDMVDAGYQIFSKGTCAADLVYNGQKRPVACLGELAGGGGEKRLGAERRAAADGQSSVPSRERPAVVNPQPANLPAPGLTVVSDTSRTPRTLLSDSGSHTSP